MEHSISTPFSLNLIYKTFHFVPLDLRIKEVVMLYSSTNFYRLFFSWSYSTRDIFQALMLFQIEQTFMHKMFPSLTLINNKKYSNIFPADPQVQIQQWREDIISLINGIDNLNGQVKANPFLVYEMFKNAKAS